MARTPDYKKYEEILNSLAKGSSHREIQSDLSVSPNTIQNAINWDIEGRPKKSNSSTKNSDNNNKKKNQIIKQIIKGPTESELKNEYKKDLESEKSKIADNHELRDWENTGEYYFNDKKEIKLDIGDAITVWDCLNRCEKQLSGNRSQNFQKTLKPLRKKFEIFLKKVGKIW